MNIFNPRFHYARFLARKGELAKALFWSDCRDVPILSAAGMSIQVLKYADKQSPFRINALLQLGEYDEILSIWKHEHKIMEKAYCWGKLAFIMSEKLLEIKNLPVDILSYCLIESGKLDKAETLDTSLFMRWKLAIHKKNFDKATYFLQKIFCKNTLSVPNLYFSEKKLIFPENEIPVERKKGPLVSVIMTCYNEEEYIETAINSILTQRYTPIELIIVDDASNDATADIIQSWAERDKRIIPIFLKENRGTWNAKNYALEKASGEYVMMHDADDWSHPDKLKLMQEVFEKQQGIKCVSSRLIRISQHSGEPFSRDISGFIRWNPSSLLFRKGFIQRYGGYLNVLGADCEIAARHELMFGPKSHARLNLPLTIALMRPNSLSSRFRGVNNGRCRIEAWEKWRFSHVEYVQNHHARGLKTHE